ncbi:MAG: hypothetical protein ACUVTW_11530 [Thermogutta sp.]
MLALAAWWGVSLTFAPLLHRHAAEPGSDFCGPICLGPSDVAPSGNSSLIGPNHPRQGGVHPTRALTDVGHPGWSSAVSGHDSLHAAHCPVCHFLTQGQDRALAAVYQHREVLTAWTVFPDAVRNFSSAPHSHYSRGPPIYM